MIVQPPEYYSDATDNDDMLSYDNIILARSDNDPIEFHGKEIWYFCSVSEYTLYKTAPFVESKRYVLNVVHRYVTNDGKFNVLLFDDADGVLEYIAERFDENHVMECAVAMKHIKTDKIE